jgi:hypothetical protein
LKVRQGRILVVGELKDLIESNDAENASCGRRDIAKDKPMAAISKQFPEAKQSRNARGSHNIDVCKINDDIAVAAVTDDFHKRLNFTPHPRLSRQVNENNVIGPVLKAHCVSPKTNTPA